MAQPNPWTETLSYGGLVSIGSHALFLRVSGPPRTSLEPVVVVEAGFSDCSTAWPAVVRLVSPFARIYTYDRAGWGMSDSSPVPRTAATIAVELSALLQAAGVFGPYIMVGHSYGGILVREFVNLRQEDCVGVVFVDPVVGEADLRWPFAAMSGIIGSLDRLEIVGLKQSTKLTALEWEDFVRGETQDRFSESSRAEYKEIPESIMALAMTKQLEERIMGRFPVSVIRGYRELDWKQCYEAGLKAGNGSLEERDTVRQFLGEIPGTYEVNQRKLLLLSRHSRFVRAESSGHQVNQEQPEVVAEEIKWVLRSLEDLKSEGVQSP